MEINLTFEKSAKKEVLDLLNKDVDKEGYIVEKNNPEQRVLTFDGEELTVKEFAGVQAGSEVFIKNDLISLIKLAKR